VGRGRPLPTGVGLWEGVVLSPHRSNARRSKVKTTGVENAELDNKSTGLENTEAIRYGKPSEQKTQDHTLQTCIFWTAGLCWNLEIIIKQ